jgi:3-hydroxyacyl-[acyl-carrier-protein] dehydratase
MPPELHFDLSTVDMNHVLYGKEAIREILPHRFDFEQLDAIVHMEPSQHIIVGYKDIRADEFWVRGHLPQYPLFPGVLMCEAAAQICSFYVLKLNLVDGEFIGFGGMDNVRFRGTVHPGDRFVLVGKAHKIERRRMLCSVQGFVKGKMVFNCDIMGLILNTPEPLVVPDAKSETKSGASA